MIETEDGKVSKRGGNNGYPFSSVRKAVKIYQIVHFALVIDHDI